MKEINNRLSTIENKHDNLSREFKERGKNHDKNNETFREIAIDYNKIVDEKNILQVEINKMKIEQAVQHSNVERMLGEIIEVKKDFKAFTSKVVDELVTINTSINTHQTRDGTIVSVVKFLMQLTALAVTISGAIIGVFRYLGLI